MEDFIFRASGESNAVWSRALPAARARNVSTLFFYFSYRFTPTAAALSAAVTQPHFHIETNVYSLDLQHPARWSKSHRTVL